MAIKQSMYDIFPVNKELHFVDRARFKYDFYIYNAIMTKMIKQMENMFSNHNKLFFMRFDLHIHNLGNIEDNNLKVSDFVRRFQRKVKRDYKLKRFAFTWVRERNTGLDTKPPHYHLYILIDGNKVKNATYLINFIKDIWTETYDRGTVHIPENCYTLMPRNNYEKINDVINRIYYLAKVPTKDSEIKHHMYSINSIIKRPPKTSPCDEKNIIKRTCIFSQ